MKKPYLVRSKEKMEKKNLEKKINNKVSRYIVYIVKKPFIQKTRTYNTQGEILIAFLLIRPTL